MHQVCTKLCSIKTLKSRINLFTQLNQMQSGALICSWKEKHIKLSHTMITYFSSCLSVLLAYHQTEDILCVNIYIQNTFISIFLHIVATKCNAVTRASKSRVMAREETPFATEDKSDE